MGKTADKVFEAVSWVVTFLLLATLVGALTCFNYASMITNELALASSFLGLYIILKYGERKISDQP